jgi:hypothetical protein
MDQALREELLETQDASSRAFEPSGLPDLPGRGIIWPNRLATTRHGSGGRTAGSGPRRRARLIEVKRRHGGAEAFPLAGFLSGMKQSVEGDDVSFDPFVQHEAVIQRNLTVWLHDHKIRS